MGMEVSQQNVTSWVGMIDRLDMAEVGVIVPDTCDIGR